MKKFILFSVSLITLFCLSATASCAASFSDVTDPAQVSAVASLSSLGIINGFSETQFKPEQSLTRGQFSKIAVTALNFNEAELYSNYTIFPDAESKMWATPYINAAARKYKILKGFPDGTFRPDEKITYAQAITVLLNMLGYQSTDIGTLWPSDYIAKAQILGISRGVSLPASQYITRGQAAVLCYNMLTADTKDGETFINTVYSNTKSDAVLLDSGEKGTDYITSNAKFCVNNSTLILNADCAFSSDLVGKSGILVMKDSKVACGFIEISDNSVQGTVWSIKADSLYIGQTYYDVPSSATIYINDSLSLYSDSWTKLKNNDTVSVFFGDDGKISFLLKINAAKSSDSKIYGVNIFSSSVEKQKIIKNGVEISASALKKYDVLTYDENNGVFYASDKKLKGIYEKAVPSYSRPQNVTVFGQPFSIPDECAGYFSKMKLGDSIVLLFDDNGTVCGAFSDSAVLCSNTGVFSSLNSNTAHIDLISSGFSVSGVVDLTVKGSGSTSGIPLVYLDVGKLVTVTQKKSGEIYVSALSSSSKKYGVWDIKNSTLGDYTISPHLAVYEQVMDNAPLCRISIEDIKADKLAASDIKNILLDNSNSVCALVIGDVTGLSWDYGIISIEKDESDPDSSARSIGLKQSGSDFSTVIKRYSPLYSSGIKAAKPGAIPKGMDSLPFIKNLTGKTLSAYTSVSASAFDGAQGVSCFDNYIEISDNVQVYLSDSKKFISLAEALMNYDKFTIYLNRAANDNPECIFISAD